MPTSGLVRLDNATMSPGWLHPHRGQRGCGTQAWVLGVFGGQGAKPKASAFRRMVPNGL